MGASIELRGIALVCLLGISSAALVTTAVPAVAQGKVEVAKVASVQNVVETKAAGSGDWEPSQLREPLFENARVRTGAASRAAILYSDKTLHRMNEKSELEVLAPSSGARSGVLKVISGGHYFSSRSPKDYGRVETPTVTAAIKGTEFAVQVDADGTTTISMLEGVVEASNAYGSIDIGRGEQAYVEPGQAPVRRILVKPRDAVNWTLYYPSVLGGSDADRLQSMGRDGDALMDAARLLSAGQVNEARSLIDAVRRTRPKEPTALALASVIEVVNDNKEEARSLADQAHEADDQSAAAALSVSFAAQAQFDIELAREMAEEAASLDPESPAALARAAELALAEGDTKGARRNAERALRRSAGNARALSVMGFILLAEYKTKQAEEQFRKAIDSDPSLPLPRMGLGIALMRRNQMQAGREELQTAAILDPYNSLLRSYLGKAYYEEKAYKESSTELQLAKELDPSDPTPHLYDALLKETYNRPVEALGDLQTAIELNDNRAVYRSRMLLDQDRAVRAADQARIYNELGFEQLGVVAARRSADQDQSNFSSHMLLAGNYRSLPGFAPAFLSESLQARIYQPISTNAARPDVVNESVSFNEYTALFDRNRLRGFAGASFGDVETDISGTYPPGAMCPDPINGGGGLCEDVISLDSSSPYGYDVTGTISRDRFAAALSYTEVQDDGFRVNTDSERQSMRLFATVAPTYKDTLQFNIQRTELQNGDLPLRQLPFLITPERFDSELDNWAIGYHRIVSPKADFAVSAIYNKTVQMVARFDTPTTSETTLEGPQLEAQYVRRQGRTTWTAGAGAFDGEQEVVSGGTTLKGDDKFGNAYVYAKIRDLGKFEVTAGLAYEDLEAPVGLISPRDSQIGAAELSYVESQVSPKLGAAWHLTPKAVLRASAFSRLTPAIGRVQSLEPTQVMGFNQFFDERGGTSSWSYGLGWDQTFGKRVFAGISAFYRDLTVPEAYCDNPDQFSGCAFQPASEILERDAESIVGVAYFNATIGKRVSVGATYGYDDKDFDYTQVSPLGLFQDYVRTQRFVPEVRAFLPMGLFFVLRGSYWDQRIDEFDDFGSTDRLTLEEDFWIGDFEVGYRFPKRYGTAFVRVANFTDEKFTIFLNPIETQLVPARSVLVGLSVQN